MNLETLRETTTQKLPRNRRAERIDGKQNTARKVKAKAGPRTSEGRLGLGERRKKKEGREEKSVSLPVPVTPRTQG